MTVQEVFDRFCRLHRLGHREDIENYPDVPAAPAYAHTRKIAEELIASARNEHPQLPPIHFDFMHDPSVNAAAFRVGEMYFIGLTSGAMLMLHLVLRRMLASPETFPKIGNPAGEDPNITPVPWHVANAERLWNQGIRPVPIRDHQRTIYYNHLADQVLMFLVGHEIAHITRGHVDYLNAAHGASFVRELGWKGTSQELLERQAIEADADRRSVAARCHSALGTARRARGITPHWASAPLSVMDWQFDWAFAVNTLFRLFGDERFSGTDLNKESYPPLPLRRKMAMDTAEDLLARRLGEGERTASQETLAKAVQATEDAFTAIGAAPADGGLAEARSPAGQQHIGRIDACWQELRKELQPLSYERLV